MSVLRTNGPLVGICIGPKADKWKCMSDLSTNSKHVFSRDVLGMMFMFIYEPHLEKTNILHMQKQRCRSAPLFSLHGLYNSSAS